MPEPANPIQLFEERVTFENWEAEGCHVFVGPKHVLTLNTPESLSDPESDRCFIEDWISPDEFCEHLTAVLRALGASVAVIAQVEQERQNYRERPVTPPTRSSEDLLRSIIETSPRS